MSSSKKMTFEWTLRQVLFRVYLLEIQSVMMVLSRPSFVNCCPSNLLSGSTLPLPCVNKYTVYTCTVCKGGGVWSSWPLTDKRLPQSPFIGQFNGMTTFCIAFYDK